MVEGNACQLCAFVSPTKAYLIYHIIHRHHYDPNFCVNCPCCAKNFKVWSSFKKHVKRKHANVSECLNEPLEIETNHPDNFMATSNQTSVKDVEAAFLLQLSQRFNLPQKGVQFVAEGMRNIVNLQLSEFRSRIGEFTDSESHKAIIDQYGPLLDGSSFFNSMDNFEKLKAHFRNIGLFVSPRAVCLGNRQWVKIVNDLPTITETPCYGYIIPFMDKLSIVLSLPEVAKRRKTAGNRELLTSMLDGNYFKSHKFAVFFKMCFCNLLSL